VWDAECVISHGSFISTVGAANFEPIVTPGPASDAMKQDIHGV